MPSHVGRPCWGAGAAYTYFMDLPAWHEAGLPPQAVINLRAIAQLDGAPSYSALRSYATGRRMHALYGPMPDPVARIANRRLWLKTDIEWWLTCPIDEWRRNADAVNAWIQAGRPRGRTMTVDHG